MKNESSPVPQCHNVGDVRRNFLTLDLFNGLQRQPEFAHWSMEQILGDALLFQNAVRWVLENRKDVPPKLIKNAEQIVVAEQTEKVCLDPQYAPWKLAAQLAKCLKFTGLKPEDADEIVAAAQGVQLRDKYQKMNEREYLMEEIGRRGMEYAKSVVAAYAISPHHDLISCFLNEVRSRMGVNAIAGANAAFFERCRNFSDGPKPVALSLESLFNHEKSFAAQFGDMVSPATGCCCFPNLEQEDPSMGVTSTLKSIISRFVREGMVFVPKCPVVINVPGRIEGNTTAVVEKPQWLKACMRRDDFEKMEQLL